MQNDFKLFDMLLEKADHAAKRTRWILLVSMVVSFVQLGAAYNFSLGFLRSFSELMVFKYGQLGFDERNYYLKELQLSLIKGWVESMTVNVGLLGVKFSVVDASLIGVIALMIVSAWLFYSARRENHIIGKTCILAENSSAEIKEYVFYGLSFTQMFGSLSNNDSPISSLSREDSGASNLRFVLLGLLYLPVIAAVLMIFSDIASVFWYKSVFRGCDTTFFDYATTQDICAAHSPFWDQLEFRFFLTIFIQTCFCLLITRFIDMANGYRRGTISLLRGLQKDWINSNS